jgi:nucleotide-binding universal stress UspA family protein
VYKRVLVALGATRYRESMTQALTIAEDQDVQLRLVHVIDVMISGAEGLNIESVYAAREREAKAILERAIAQAREANVNPEYALIDGEGRRISSVLRQEVTRWRADLIVVGGRVRRNLLLRLLSDDICDAIISSASVPILLAAPSSGNDVSGTKAITHNRAV